MYVADVGCLRAHQSIHSRLMQSGTRLHTSKMLSQNGTHSGMHPSGGRNLDNG
ncbi:hypothetical protein DAPPUDRAFT_239208 [Daphnia pulex]|uniref:Uncharacterized protein n=1 Tax=Daphnia pulex TaxID=6669 RepID=E9G8M7_DAPPU|nr:hypothetical protein DAPPUDRAFT_239208 [Daphnia pulex]|eukprot:EFX84239.1 hypothetical protein DAPPUDRAFT_239208 [Daphnia pulex]